MKKYFLLSIFTCLYLFSFSQTTSKENPAILLKGKIAFERKINQYKQLDEMSKGRPNNGSNNFVEMMKKNNSKYKIDQFELFFTENTTLYKPAPNGISESKMMMGNIPADKNIVYTDFKKNTQIAEKSIFEKIFLITDSIQKYQWKIKEEFRNIAGYTCRRAETIIMDSVYVIAFYSDAIIADGGPESFNGLPGMILGLVLPRLNVTYFATKVENYLPNENEIIAPTKGDKKSKASVEKVIKDNANNWGNFIQRTLWYVNI